MSPRRAVIALSAIIAVACTEDRTEFSLGHRAAIVDSVQSALGDLRVLAAQGLRDSIPALYADTTVFRWVEDGAVRYRSVAEVRVALGALPSGATFVTTYDDIEITPLAPGLAWVSMRFSTRFGDPDAGGFQFGGAMTLTLIHQTMGWRILTGHTSSPRRGQS